MSAPLEPLTLTSELRKIFCLPCTEDPDYPHCFCVKLPPWSKEDIDLLRWIRGYGAEVEVIEPQPIVASMRTFSSGLASLYGPHQAGADTLSS